MKKYHLAQINIARMKGTTIDDPIMAEFVANLDRINALAESSLGFVWRLKDDDNNATAFNPYNDEQIIVNASVWESIEALERFAFNSDHVAFVRRRREWFQSFGKAYTAMWWIPAGTVPTVAEMVQKLSDLQANGPSQEVFDFRMKFGPPN
jgi:hypothetical protein